MIFQLHLHMLNTPLCTAAPALIYVTSLPSPTPFLRAVLRNAVEQSFKGVLAFFPLSLLFLFYSLVYFVFGNMNHCYLLTLSLAISLLM